MPTLFIIFGLRFYFYADEHLPIHVHVENEDGRAKIIVEPKIELLENRGIKTNDLKKAMKIVETYQKEIISEWHKFHGE